MTEEPEVCNVISSSKDWIPFEKSATFLISYRKYHDDLSLSLRSRAHVRRQLEVDLPRCDFWINGELQKNLSHTHIPIKFQRFCTQTVMGLPFCVLQSFTDDILCEPDSACRLTFEMWDSEYLIVSKKLALKSAKDFSIIEYVSVEVRVSLSDSWVLVLFRRAAT